MSSANVNTVNYDKALDTASTWAKKAYGSVFNSGNGKTALQGITDTFSKIGSGTSQVLLRPYTGEVSSPWFARTSGLALRATLPSYLKLAGVLGAGGLGIYSLCLGANKFFTSVQVAKNQHPNGARHGIVYEAISGTLATVAGAGALIAIVCPPLGIASGLVTLAHASVPALSACFLGSIAMNNFTEIAHGNHWLIRNSFFGIFSPLIDKETGLSALHGVNHAATYGLDKTILKPLGLEREPSSYQESRQRNQEYIESKRTLGLS